MTKTTLDSNGHIRSRERTEGSIDPVWACRRNVTITVFLYEPSPSNATVMKTEVQQMSNDVTAAIVRKTARSQDGALYILVRASAFGEDKAVSVSRQDYDRLQPGMLVRMFRAGWGPTSQWRLRR